MKNLRKSFDLTKRYGEISYDESVMFTIEIVLIVLKITLSDKIKLILSEYIKLNHIFDNINSMECRKMIYDKIEVSSSNLSTYNKKLLELGILYEVDNKYKVLPPFLVKLGTTNIKFELILQCKNVHEQ